MRRLCFGLFGVTAVAASLLLAPAASTAAEYPWCAQYGSDNDGTNCGLTTFEQCRLTLSGNGGFCVRNPFYSGKAEQSDHPKRNRARN